MEENVQKGPGSDLEVKKQEKRLCEIVVSHSRAGQLSLLLHFLLSVCKVLLFLFAEEHRSSSDTRVHYVFFINE